MSDMRVLQSVPCHACDERLFHAPVCQYVKQRDGIAESMRTERERDLERELAGANGAADGYAEALHALCKVLTGPKFRDRDTCSIDAVLHFASTTAHAHALARGNAAQAKATQDQ